MKFLGISKPCEINKGKYLGNAYHKYEPKLSTSTYIYDDKGVLSHDITVTEDLIEVYKDFTGNLIYHVLDKGGF